MATTELVDQAEAFAKDNRVLAIWNKRFTRQMEALAPRYKSDLLLKHHIFACNPREYVLFGLSKLTKKETASYLFNAAIRSYSRNHSPIIWEQASTDSGFSLTFEDRSIPIRQSNHTTKYPSNSLHLIGVSHEGVFSMLGAMAYVRSNLSKVIPRDEYSRETLPSFPDGCIALLLSQGNDADTPAIDALGRAIDLAGHEPMCEISAEEQESLLEVASACSTLIAESTFIDWVFTNNAGNWALEEAEIAPSLEALQALIGKGIRAAARDVTGTRLGPSRTRLTEYQLPYETYRADRDVLESHYARALKSELQNPIDIDKVDPVQNEQDSIWNVKRAIKKLDGKLNVRIFPLSDETMIGDLCVLLENTFTDAMLRDEFEFNHYDREGFLESLQKKMNGIGCTLVATYKDEVVGTISAEYGEIDEWFYQGPVHIIKHFAVSPACQGKRIGYTLHEQMEQLLLQKQDIPIVLSTPLNNRGSVRFYERAGYRKVRIFKTAHLTVRLVKGVPFDQIENKRKAWVARTAMNARLALLPNVEQFPDEELNEIWNMRYAPYVESITDWTLADIVRSNTEYGLTPYEYCRYHLWDKSDKKRKLYVTEDALLVKQLTAKSFLTDFDNSAQAPRRTPALSALEIFELQSMRGEGLLKTASAKQKQRYAPVTLRRNPLRIIEEQR